MVLEENLCDDVEMNHLAQNSDQSRVLENTIMKDR